MSWMFTKKRRSKLDFRCPLYQHLTPLSVDGDWNLESPDFLYPHFGQIAECQQPYLRGNMRLYQPTAGTSSYPGTYFRNTELKLRRLGDNTCIICDSKLFHSRESLSFQCPTPHRKCATWQSLFLFLPSLSALMSETFRHTSCPFAFFVIGIPRSNPGTSRTE